MLLLLLLAFLKPVWPRFGSGAAGKGDRHVLILFDHSLSMEHRGDGPTARERALHEAANLLGTLAPEDWVNVVLIEQPPRSCFVDFSRNHAEARQFLQRLKPGFTRGDVNQANTFAARLLSKAKTGVEVYFLSDFQRKNWSAVDFTGFPAGARLFFVDVGARYRDNRAVLEVHPAASQLLAGDTVPIEITLGNFAEQPFQDRVTVVLDGRLSFDQDVFIGPWSSGRFAVPVPVGTPGIHRCEVRLPDDALEHDNRYYLTLPTLEKEEVLIVSDEPAEAKGSAYFLKMALNPFDDLRGSLLPNVIPSSELTTSRLAGVRKIFLLRLNRLSDESAAALAKSLFLGAGVICFLDGNADAINLATLESATGPKTMPLQLTSHRSVTNVASGAQQIVRGDFKSRFLKMFRGVTRQDLALLEFYDYWQARATGAGSVLLVYGDESPAMAVTGHGLGTLILLNFSAGESSSNLARQRLFPAWMQELVKAVSAEEPPPTAFTVGEPLHTEVWKNDLQDAGFLSPSGQPVTLKRELSGERYSVTFGTDQLGFYTLGQPKLVRAFGVNASPDESDLRPVDKELLPSQAGETQEAHYLSGRDEFEQAAAGRPLFHWFVFAAVAFLLVENGFQMLVRKAKS
jgi:hypothetical protein